MCGHQTDRTEFFHCQPVIITIHGRSDLTHPHSIPYQQDNIFWFIRKMLRNDGNLYRFLHYSDETWALDGVRYNTMDKVLWSGMQDPDDDIHFIQASVIYRLEQ